LTLDWKFWKRKSQQIAPHVTTDAGYKNVPDPPKNPECAACQEDIPLFRNGKGELAHIDLFATPEAGAMYPCPVKEAPVESQ